MNNKLIIALILVFVAVIFIVQNMVVVDLRFLFWKLSMSRALLFITLILIGMAIGWLGHSFFTHKKIPK